MDFVRISNWQLPNDGRYSVKGLILILVLDCKHCWFGRECCHNCSFLDLPATNLDCAYFGCWRKGQKQSTKEERLGRLYGLVRKFLKRYVDF